jgi:hypothetical protein
VFDIWAELPAATDVTHVFHYTSAGALISILEKDQLWATAAHALNDTSELVNGQVQLTKALEKLKKKFTAEESRLAEHLLSQIDFFVQDHEYFIACASTNSDSLNLWRNYAAGQGHAIMIENNVAYAPLTIEGGLFDMNLHGIPRVQIHRWTRVIYDEEEQMRIAELFLEEELHDPDSNLHRYVDSTDDKEKVTAWSGLRTAVVPMLALFKHPAFSVEEEVRLLFESWGPNDVMQPSFRPGGYGVAPYIKLTVIGHDLDEMTYEPFGPLKPQPLPVIGIIPGPSTDDQGRNKVRALQALCKATGHDRAMWFLSSSIPLAGWA